MLTLLTAFDLFWISWRMHQHDVCIQKKLRYNAVMHCLIHTHFPPIYSFLGIFPFMCPNFESRPSTHLVIHGDNFYTLLTPMIGRATKEALLSLAHRFLKIVPYSYLLYFLLNSPCEQNANYRPEVTRASVQRFKPWIFNSKNVNAKRNFQRCSFYNRFDNSHDWRETGETRSEG